MSTDIATDFIIADNQSITRTGIRVFIENLYGQCPIINVEDKKQLISALEKQSRHTVVIIDYTLFDFESIDRMSLIGKRFPNVSWLMFSVELQEPLLRLVGYEQNIGILFKESNAEEITAALRITVAGGRFICHQVSELLLTHSTKDDTTSRLTPTEIEILKLIAKGKSAKEIAAERISSVHTIITHKKNIFRKIGVNTAYEATRYAVRAGIADTVDYYI